MSIRQRAQQARYGLPGELEFGPSNNRFILTTSTCRSRLKLGVIKRGPSSLNSPLNFKSYSRVRLVAVPPPSCAASSNRNDSLDPLIGPDVISKVNILL